jgi:hypothetical protein
MDQNQKCKVMRRDSLPEISVFAVDNRGGVELYTLQV